MNTINDHCWICGSPANTHEHLFKASDIRSVFGQLNERHPLLFHDPNHNPTKVYGIGNNRLRFKAKICANCNNKRTQPHDYAWEDLSAYLRSNPNLLKPNATIRLHKAFPGKVSRSMLNVHLFFLKLFGCLIKQYNIPIPLTQFSKAILNGTAHPNIWISFGTGLKIGSIKHVSCSQVATYGQHGRIKYASWFYSVDNISANVIYAEHGQYRKGLIRAWHPKSVGKRLQMSIY